MKVSVTVCDVCQKQGVGTEAYEVKGPRGRVSLDLCEAHAQTLLGLMSAGRAAPGRKPAARAPQTPSRASKAPARRRKVVDMDEIEMLRVGAH